MSAKIKRTKKKWFVLGIIVLVLVFGFLFAHQQMKKISSDVSQNLSATELKKTTLENTISAGGTIASGSVTEVTSALNYTVKTVGAQLGDSVEKGDILAVFNTTDLKKSVSEAQESYDSAVKQYKLKVSQAKESLLNAKENVSDAKTSLADAKAVYAGAVGDAKGSDAYKTRYEEAEDKDQSVKTAAQNLSTAKDNLTQAENNYDSTVANDTTESAKSQLDAAKENLEKATVKAPVSGVVSAVNVTVGNAPAGGSLFTIQSGDDFIINASVADYDVIQLSVGQKVTITVDSTNDTYSGKILTISPVANSAGNYDFTVSVIDPDKDKTRVGMDATVKIVLEKKKNIYAVTVDSIVEEDNKKYVIALDTSDPKNVIRTEIEVMTGMETDYYVEISGSGLEDGLMIMNDPQGKLTTEETSVSSDRRFPGFGSVGGI